MEQIIHEAYLIWPIKAILENGKTKPNLMFMRLSNHHSSLSIRGYFLLLQTQLLNHEGGKYSFANDMVSAKPNGDLVLLPVTCRSGYL